MSDEERFEKWYSGNVGIGVPYSDEVKNRMLIRKDAYLVAMREEREAIAQMVESCLARDDNGRARNEGANRILYQIIESICARGRKHERERI